MRDKTLAETIRKGMDSFKEQLNVDKKPDALTKPITETNEAAQNQATLMAFTVTLLQSMDDTLKEILVELKTGKESEKKDES